MSYRPAVAVLVLVAAITGSPAVAAANVTIGSAYVTNLGANTVSQYDLGSGDGLTAKSAPTVGTGVAPQGLAISPDGTSLYVANTTDNTLSEFDVGAGGALTAKATPTIATGSGPIGVAVSPDGQSVYVTNQSSNSVSQYDVGAGGTLSAKTPATVNAGNAPELLKVSPDGHSVYVTNFSSGNVSQYDVGAGGALSAKAQPTVTAGSGALGIAISPNGASVYVTNATSDTVSQYDVGTGGALSPKTPATVATGNDPGGVAVSPDGSNVYVVDFQDDNLSEYDAGTGGALSAKTPATVATGSEPVDVAMSNDGASVYVTNYGANTVSQYTVGTGGVVTAKTPPTATAGTHPDFIAIAPATAPAVSTGAADAVTARTATLHGTVNPTGSSVTDCHFDYGTSTAYGLTAPCAETVGSGTADVAVHADISGLAPATTYHFRLEATNGGGAAAGADATVRTSAAAPSVTAGSATALEPDSATLHGTVDPNGSSVSDCHFEYGTTTAYGTSVPCAESVGGGTAAVPVSAAISGLSPNTTYDFRLVATNGIGPANDTGTFTTTPIETTITSGPAGPTNNPTPTFGFTANPPAGATFECSIDHGSKSPCASPFTTGHLADGSHELEVTAVAPGGLQDPTPATRTFVIDTVAPVTNPQVVGGQRSPTSSTIHGSVLLVASPTDPAPSGGGVHTRCEYEGATQPPPTSYGAMPDSCTTPIVSVPGSYVFYAASSDAAGNVETVRSVGFTLAAGVDATITAGPAGSTWEKEPTFGFTTNTPGASFRCRIDGGAYVPCQTPWLSPIQNSGAHAFYLIAVAPDGTQSPVQARYYTIEAPRTDPATEPHGHCAIDPYTIDPTNPNGRAVIGCGFGHCPARIHCLPALDPCPTGAICTLTFTSHFAAADPAITFQLVSLCQQQNTNCTVYEMDDSWSVVQNIGLPVTTGCQLNVLGDPTQCASTRVATFIGSGRSVSPLCYVELDDPIYQAVRPGETQARDFGPDSSRHLDCDATESISPASPLDLASVPPSSLSGSIFVPSAGTLGVIGTLLGRASDARAHVTPAPVAAIKLAVRHAGAVALHFRLSATARRLLARRHKLAVRLKLTLSVAHQGTITRVHTITFTQPPKGPTARQRRRQARRLCLRRHPRATRACNRL